MHRTELDALMAGRHKRASRLWRRMWREYLTETEAAPQTITASPMPSNVHPFDAPEPGCLGRLDPTEAPEPRGLMLRFRYGLAA